MLVDNRVHEYLKYILVCWAHHKKIIKTMTKTNMLLQITGNTYKSDYKIKITNKLRIT